MTGKYGIFIYWSDEDQVYIAEVPDLPGCITHGDTRNAALANAIEAIELWVDTAKEFNKPVPKPEARHSSISAARAERSRSKGGQGAIPSMLSRRKNQLRVYYDFEPRIGNPQVQGAKE